MQIDPVSASSTFQAAIAPTETEPPGEAPSFMEMLGKAIEEVGASQQRADDLVTRLLAGEDIAPHEVILAVEQANLTLQTSLQVRNRVLDAYQEIARMQI